MLEPFSRDPRVEIVTVSKEEGRRGERKEVAGVRSTNSESSWGCWMTRHVTAESLALGGAAHSQGVRVISAGL